MRPPTNHRWVEHKSTYILELEVSIFIASLTLLLHGLEHHEERPT